MSLVDPLGKLVTEIRDDAAVIAYPCTRVRGGEPWPEQRNGSGVVTMTADSQGPGHYNRFVLVRRLVWCRHDLTVRRHRRRSGNRARRR